MERTTSQLSELGVDDARFSKVAYAPPGGGEIERQNVGELPGARAFLLHNVLSAEECNHYISATEDAGYSSIAAEYPTAYRNNWRVLALMPEFMNDLWDRIKPFIYRADIASVRPIGFGTDGIWSPIGLNECVKFSRYEGGASQKFAQHIDSPFVRHDDEQSIFTVMVYLNDNFQQGQTVFYPQGMQLHAKRPASVSNSLNRSIRRTDGSRIRRCARPALPGFGACLQPRRPPCRASSHRREQ
jgi:hypothetical protein